MLNIINENLFDVQVKMNEKIKGTEVKYFVSKDAKKPTNTDNRTQEKYPYFSLLQFNKESYKDGEPSDDARLKYMIETIKEGKPHIINKINAHTSYNPNNIDEHLFLIAIPFKGNLYNSESSDLIIIKTALISLDKPIVVNGEKLYKIAYLLAMLPKSKLRKALPEEFGVHELTCKITLETKGNLYTPNRTLDEEKCSISKIETSIVLECERYKSNDRYENKAKILAMNSYEVKTVDIKIVSYDKYLNIEKKFPPIEVASFAKRQNDKPQYKKRFNNNNNNNNTKFNDDRQNDKKPYNKNGKNSSNGMKRLQEQKKKYGN